MQQAAKRDQLCRFSDQFFDLCYPILTRLQSEWRRCGLMENISMPTAKRIHLVGQLLQEVKPKWLGGSEAEQCRYFKQQLNRSMAVARELYCAELLLLLRTTLGVKWQEMRRDILAAHQAHLSGLTNSFQYQAYLQHLKMPFLANDKLIQVNQQQLELAVKQTDYRMMSLFDDDDHQLVNHLLEQAAVVMAVLGKPIDSQDIAIQLVVNAYQYVRLLKGIQQQAIAVNEYVDAWLKAVSHHHLRAMRGFLNDNFQHIHVIAGLGRGTPTPVTPSLFGRFSTHEVILECDEEEEEHDVMPTKKQRL